MIRTLGIDVGYTNSLYSRFFGPEEDAAAAATAEAEAATVAEAATAAAAAATAARGGAEKTFKQADVDKIIDARFKKERTEKEKLIADLTKLRDESSLTKQEKDELASRIESMESSLRTKEEQIALEKKRDAEKHKTELDKLQNDAVSWKNRFTESTIKRALTDAAVMNNAEDTSQLVLMFGSQTRLDEERDSAGKLTGDFIAKMKFQGIDAETKKPAPMDLPVMEAIQHMRDNGLHKNLFKHGARGGTGQEGGGATGTGDPTKMPQPANYASMDLFRTAYDKWRAEQTKK